MADLYTIKGTVAQGLAIVDALCGNYNYQETISDPENEGGTIPNPISKVAFAKSKIVDFLKENYTAYKAKEANTTRLELISDAEIAINGLSTN